MKKEIVNRLSAMLRFWSLGLVMILASCEDETEFAQDYDIAWPTPQIETLSAQQAFVDEIVTITGTGLDNTTKVTLDGEVCEILENSVTPTEVKFKVARRAKTGKVEVHNLYRRKSVAESSLIINYPEVEVTKWPTVLYVGKPFTLEGVNIDLITEVIVKDSVIAIKQPASTTKLVVPTSSLNLKAGETVTIKVNSLGPISVKEVTGVMVEEDVPLPTLVGPIVLWTFEEGDPVITDAGNAPTSAGRNLGGLTAPRGEKYFTVTKTQTGGWTNFIYIEKQGPFDLTEFNDPHITMLINTKGKRGYINPFFTQGGSEKDNHLTNGNANERMRYGDDYAVQTNGWEWRSYPLSKMFPDFTSTGVFDKVRMRFTSGNVGNGGSPEDFEIHVDQIMITDGLQLPKEKVWDFEDDAYTWDNNLSPTHGINLSPVTKGAGMKFLTVKKAGVAAWQWQGAVAKNQVFDMSSYIDPHISFLINTGNEKGYVQIEVFQNNTKWGGNSESVNYLFDTKGQWKSVTLRLSEILGNWGGDASAFNPAGSLDYIKIGFTTGNVDGAYEVNIDDVYLSDGGMW